VIHDFLPRIVSAPVLDETVGSYDSTKLKFFHWKNEPFMPVEQVVVRHPLGIPYGADMNIFAPYLSKTLLHRFDVSNACFADWRKRIPDSRGRSAASA
jgi:hypothetical protein